MALILCNYLVTFLSIYFHSSLPEERKGKACKQVMILSISPECSITSPKIFPFV